MMLQPLRQSRRQAVVRAATIPAPVGGWDAISPLSNMPTDRATLLDNFFPREGYVELRAGFVEWSTTGETTPVETVMGYQAVSPTDDRLFAVTNGKIFDVTAAGEADAALVSGLSNSRLQHVNFTTSGGHFLFCVNGADPARCFDGASWTTPTITGASSSEFAHVATFKNRLMFAANGKLGFYFLPVDSIGGAASYYELGGVFSGGGYLAAIGTWTIDGGEGVDDHAVFVSSRGQIAVFKGTDPSSAATWALGGVFNGGAPLGRRCLVKVGADIVLVTVEGVIPLSKSLIMDRAALKAVAISQNIAPQMNKAARSYGGNFGWQLIGYPRGTMAIVNIPVQEGQTQHQYVMNTITGAWARFTGQNANCWELFEDSVFFGGNAGGVFKADTGPSDDGADIVADLATAWNYFGARGSLKRWPMIQPVIVSDGLVAPGVVLNTDFRERTPSSAGMLSNAGALIWDAFDWDDVDWPEDVSVSTQWQSSSAFGTCASVRMRIVANSTSANPVLLQVNSFNVTIERGGVL